MQSRDTKDDLINTIANISEKKTKEPFFGVHMQKNGMTHSGALTNLLSDFPEVCDIQLFVRGPASIKSINIDPLFKKTAQQLDVDINVHGSYLCVPWKSPFLFKHTLDNFRDAHEIGGNNVVLHIPFMPINEWLPSIVKLVAQIRKDHLTPLVMMETSATIEHPQNSYESPEKLNRLTYAIYKANIHTNVVLCIDTAHIHASRVQIFTYNQAKRYCDKLDKRLIGSIQLNGNSVKPGKNKTSDMHEIPLSREDLIWGGMKYHESGCRAFIEMAMELNIPIIVEWNKNHSRQSLREFINKIRL
jgi:endonuclease IV